MGFDEKDKIQKEIADEAGKKFRGLFILLLVLVIMAFIGVATLVVYVDPFFHYHSPLEGFPYIVDNQLSQNPGMARNMDYNSCIIGSSMTVNFDTDDFKDIMGLDTLKLSYSGAYPKDDYNILSIVFDEKSYARKGNPVDAVFFALDIPTMAADTETTKYPRPEYLYDDNLFNDVKYVLNKDVVLQYILRPIIQGKGSDLSEIYFSWWTPEYYNIQWVMHTYEEPAKNENELPKDALLKNTEDNLDKNIIPFIEQNPDTQFYIFFPPYSILYWHNIMQENTFEATFAQYQYVADRLLGYENVHLFYFQNMDEVTDLNNYADYSHYKPEINRYMVECFKNGAHQVKSSEEMADELLKMRDIINEFDFKWLFSVDWG
ncbi:hypothetical protein [Butyrivibrio sp. YAB3001]|uniref:hypothetical protein n=1 Tax=Butyrivibrio sp. YAB3001 TaxID=1520812 RepID=UPI0008F63025|nr:hypothetical protein [Butyrivibrio sp. YAB3001]SFC77662.1 hypothetical protein SAMN02910398_03124 [Butyrivibrio sp. YAB3001]